MHIICPHCRNPIEVVRVAPAEEIGCPSCGSSFRLETGSTTAAGFRPGRMLGKFEVIDTVGHGAFGTVYKARDPELDRVVALKAPRAGHAAGPQELDRFLREARSAAQLRHPAIVAVHEVGVADGAPYIVSDFVQGVTLADLLSARRPGFRDAAELIAAVADALQYAHERGVIHRDVKPSNIMIGDDGRPAVMDFGLAKREAGEITMTVEGQVLGTPAYMSPEQARGEGHQVDGRGDVYSVGVVLYVLLTGELPFRGTQRMLLHQVLYDDPRPPRRLNDRIPRDLETICLKAMAKAPGRRYATARDLADDLRRWLKGEAIRARSVGTWERIVRWARRRPAVAALMALFIGSLLAGTAVSTWFAFQSNANYQESRRHETDTKNALQQVTEREKQVSEANTDLDAKTRELEDTLAVSLLRPLGQVSFQVTDPEVDALWELAGSRNERVRVSFIEKALQRPVTARQLRNRADVAVHAAVGLDPARRRHVEEALLTRLRDRDGNFSLRTDCALIAVESADWRPDVASAGARQLVEAMGNATDLREIGVLAEALSALAPRLEAGEASAAARRLVEAIEKTNNFERLRGLAAALTAVAPQLEPGEATAVARKVLDVMRKTTDTLAMNFLAEALSALAPRLEAGEASAAARQLVEAILLEPPGSLNTGPLAEALTAVAPRVESGAAADAARQLLDAMEKTDFVLVRHNLEPAFAALALRLGPEDASADARRLLEAMGKPTDLLELRDLGVALSALTPRLDPGEASAAARQVLQVLAMWKTQGTLVLTFLPRTLATLAPRLEPGEARASAREAVGQILEAMGKLPPGGLHMAAMAEGVAALAPWLEPDEASAAARQLAETMGKTTDSRIPPSLGAALVALAPRLAPGEASAVARRLVELLGKTTDASTLGSSDMALAALAAHLEPGEARAAAQQVVRHVFKMVETTDPFARRGPATALAALAPRIDPGEASAMVRVLLLNMRMLSGHPDAVGLSAEALAALAPRLAPGEASAAARQVVEAMTKTGAPQFVLQKAWVALASRLEPGEASAAAQTAARQVLEEMGKEIVYTRIGTMPAPPRNLDTLKALAAVIVKIEPNDYARRVGALAGAVGDLGAPSALFAGLAPLAEASRPLPGRLTEQQLVDLLKMPTCRQPARQVIVRQLGWQCGQTFADQWEFVDWAREHRPDLDLTSPPVRPPSP